MSQIDKPKRILITGGAGFIGSNVVQILRERYPGTQLRVLHLPKENLRNLQCLDVELMAGDITNPTDVKLAISDCDVVFHLAAIYAFWLPDMSAMQRVNVEGTRLVLEECLRQEVSRVVYTSSAVCFAGHGLDTISTENSAFALGNQVYAKSKHDSHSLAETYAAKGLNIVIVCPVVPMGPGDVGPTPSGRLITDIFTLPLPIAPSSEMNIIDVRDCAMGHVLAMERGRSGESYILGGENYRYKDMLRRVLRICGVHKPILEVSPTLLYPMAYAMLAASRLNGKAPLLTPAEIDISKRGLICDAAKARQELGLTVRPLEQTLRDALCWFVEHGYITDKNVVARFQPREDMPLLKSAAKR